MRLATAAVVLLLTFPLHAEDEKSDAAEFLGWLLESKRDLQGIDFSEVLAVTSGKKIIPVNSAGDKPWLDKLSAILDRTLAKLNDPAHPIHSAGRIN